MLPGMFSQEKKPPGVDLKYPWEIPSEEFILKRGFVD